MTERKHVGLERTILCATRFWGSGRYVGPPGKHGTEWSKGATTPTLARGVKNVVRKQGFTTAEIDRGIRKLAKAGFLSIGPGHQGYGAKTRSIATLALTPKGGKVSCGTVKLAPWTDPEYPGSELRGVPSETPKGRSRLARAAYEASGMAEEGHGSQSQHCKAASAHERAARAFQKAGSDRRAYVHEQQAEHHRKRCG